MMIGPTKKKVIIASVVAFVIPVLISSIIFVNYKKSVDEEIARLEKQGEVIPRYVFADNMIAGDIITSEDIKMANVKGESAPIDSYNGSKEDLIGRKLKINAEKKTIVTDSMLTVEEDKIPTIDERYQEFNMLLLPSDLEEGDFIDIRITMVDGEDYIVISGKEVKKLGVNPESNTIFLQLDEEEMLRMTAAILESYMNEGFKIYAVKYVDPENQLYDYNRVNYVELYENTLANLIEERKKFADENLMEYINTYEPNIESGEINKLLNGLAVVDITEEDITNAEIAPLIGLTEKQTNDIRTALASEDLDLLSMYDDKLVIVRKNMVNTYPVKANIAKLITENPNIIEDLSEKYNVEKLMEQRAGLLELPLYRYNEYGELEFLEPLQKIQSNLSEQIETQRAERKEYLQALILEENGK